MFLGRPEVFWVGVQAICAVFGVAGLAVYTYYARQQAVYTQATLRASMTPYIDIVNQHPEAMQKGALTFEGYRVSYRNVGQGAALRLRSWHRHADDRIIAAFKARKIMAPENAGTAGLLDRDDLPRDGVVEASFNEYTEHSERLYVLEGEDQSGGFHQVQVLVGVRGGPQVHNLSLLQNRSRLPQRISKILGFTNR